MTALHKISENRSIYAQNTSSLNQSIGQTIWAEYFELNFYSLSALGKNTQVSTQQDQNWSYSRAAKFSVRIIYQVFNF